MLDVRVGLQGHVMCRLLALHWNDAIRIDNNEPLDSSHVAIFNIRDFEFLEILSSLNKSLIETETKYHVLALHPTVMILQGGAPAHHIKTASA